MFGYIYITTNLVNNKKYIGKHESAIFDEKYLGSGTLLKRAIEKYGIESFKSELLISSESKVDLDQLETNIIMEHHAVESGEYYNIARGGSGGDTISGKSKEEREAHAQATRDRFANYSPEEREAFSKKISSSLKGKKKTEQHKKNLSKSKKGKTKNWTNVSREEFSARRKEEVKNGINVPPRNPGNTDFKHTKKSITKMKKSIKNWHNENLEKFGTKIPPEQLSIARKSVAAASPLGVIGNRRNADKFLLKMIPIVQSIKDAGNKTIKEIINALNDQGYKTRRGTTWKKHSYLILLRKIKSRTDC